MAAIRETPEAIATFNNFLIILNAYLPPDALFLEFFSIILNYFRRPVRYIKIIIFIAVKRSPNIFFRL